MLTLEDKKIELGTQVYNKFQNKFYLLSTTFSNERIRELQIDIMLLEYKYMIKKSISNKL